MYEFASVRSGVLNPQLYERLRDLFQQVWVTAEGEPFFAKPGYDPLTGRYRLQVEHSGEYYKVKCPYCNDWRPRLFINHMFAQPEPYTRSGGLLLNLVYCFNEKCFRTYDRRRDLADRLFGFRNVAERRLELVQRVVEDMDDREPIIPRPPGICCELSCLPENHVAVRYLMERRYTPEMIRQYQIGYVLEADREYPRAANRIYFPIWQNEKYAGWQTRHVGDVNWKATGIPKYYSLPGMKKSRLLYNYDVARNYPCVVVTEGPTSAHRVGGPAVAMFGKDLSRFQAQLLVQTWVDKPIFLLLDPDARGEQGIAMMHLRGQRSAPVIGIDLPDGRDPGDYTTAALWRIIRAQAGSAGVTLP
jgi:hypothetical protein